MSSSGCGRILSFRCEYHYSQDGRSICTGKKEMYGPNVSGYVNKMMKDTVFDHKPQINEFNFDSTMK